MALLFVDNFQAYGSDENAMLDGLYATVQSDAVLSVDPDPLVSTRVLGFDAQGSLAVNVRKVIAQGAKATLGMGFRLWMNTLPVTQAGGYHVAFKDQDNNYQIILQVETTGQLSIYRGFSAGTGTTLLGTSTIPVLTANAWHHIEIKMTISDASGATEVRVDDTAVAGLTLTSVDTKNTSFAHVAQIEFYQRPGNSAMWSYVKDFWMWDTAGNAPTDFIGAKGVYWLPPDGDSSLNWSVSTGSTGWDLIDEAGPSDSDYIFADDTPPAQAEFTLEDLPADIVAVYGVMALTRMWKVDSGDATVQAGLKGTAETNGTNRSITAAATYWTDIFDVSPDTSVMWTPAEINAAIYTLDRTT